MRPEEEGVDGDLFECFDCGARARNVEGRRCEACGGALRNLSRGRDL